MGRRVDSWLVGWLAGWLAGELGTWAGWLVGRGSEKMERKGVQAGVMGGGSPEKGSARSIRITSTKNNISDATLENPSRGRLGGSWLFRGKLVRRKEVFKKYYATAWFRHKQ